jgi:hypothetical protein
VGFILWAHFRRFAPETGLSACIFFACGKKGYRSYPLRVFAFKLSGKIPRFQSRLDVYPALFFGTS